ncbi:MAG: hypothetical protein EA369_01210 [Bradymonadales bacterium]|nr:MAG: hypothetical protein EA369_01210 [Bradymonadales bacterium]
MTYLVVLLTALITVFYRESVAQYLKFKLRPLIKNTEQLQFLSASARPLKTEFLFLSSFPAGLIYVPTLKRCLILVSENFWTSLEAKESEALLIWISASRLSWTAWRALIFAPPLQKIDRDCLFLGAKTLALVSALEKLAEYRKAKSIPLFESSLTGWSPIGPSWVGDWESIPWRMKELSRLETKYRLPPLSENSDSVN